MFYWIRTLRVNKELAQTLSQKQALSLVPIPCIFVFPKALPWNQTQSFSSPAFEPWWGRRESLESQGNCRRAGRYSLHSNPLGLFILLLHLSFPLIKDHCLHNTWSHDSWQHLWLQSWGVLGRLWCLPALNGPNKGSFLVAHTSFKPLLREKLKNYSFLTASTGLMPFFIPEWSHPNWPTWGIRKQTQDKIGVKMMKDKRRRKKTCSVTLTEMGKYRAVSQSGEKNIPHCCTKERD